MRQSRRPFPLFSHEAMHAVVIAFFTADIAFMILYIGFRGLGNPLGSENPVLFDLNDEESLPTWYSSFKLLCVAFTFYFYGRITLASDRIAGIVVFMFAFTFIYFSMDETKGQSFCSRLLEAWRIHGGPAGNTSRLPRGLRDLKTAPGCGLCITPLRRGG